MIDDPLSLLSLGIWLMAAGMYPLGFLFGACSACCQDDCPWRFNLERCLQIKRLDATGLSLLAGGDMRLIIDTPVTSGGPGWQTGVRQPYNDGSRGGPLRVYLVPSQIRIAVRVSLSASGSSRTPVGETRTQVWRFNRSGVTSGIDIVGPSWHLQVDLSVTGVATQEEAGVVSSIGQDSEGQPKLVLQFNQWTATITHDETVTLFPVGLQRWPGSRLTESSVTATRVSGTNYTGWTVSKLTGLTIDENARAMEVIGGTGLATGGVASFPFQRFVDEVVVVDFLNGDRTLVVNGSTNTGSVSCELLMRPDHPLCGIDGNNIDAGIAAGVYPYNCTVTSGAESRTLYPRQAFLGSSIDQGVRQRPMHWAYITPFSEPLQQLWDAWAQVSDFYAPGNTLLWNLENGPYRTFASVSRAPNPFEPQPNYDVSLGDYDNVQTPPSPCDEWSQSVISRDGGEIATTCRDGAYSRTNTVGQNPFRVPRLVLFDSQEEQLFRFSYRDPETLFIFQDYAPYPVTQEACDGLTGFIQPGTTTPIDAVFVLLAVAGQCYYFVPQFAPGSSLPCDGCELSVELISGGEYARVQYITAGEKAGLLEVVALQTWLGGQGVTLTAACGSDTITQVIWRGLTAPEPPRNLTVTRISCTEALLQWEAPEWDGGQPITSYVVSPISPSGVVDPPAFSFTATGLLPIRYQFSVRAVNNSGFGPPSNFAVLGFNLTAPTGLALTRESPCTSVGLSWTPPQTDECIVVVSYIVQFRVLGAASWTTDATLSPDVVAYTVTGLTAGARYEFRVGSVDGANIERFTDALASGNLPATPTGVTREIGSNPDEVDVAWSASEESCFENTSYLVQFRPSTTTAWSNGPTSANKFATVTGLTAGVTYFFRVRATNSVGNSGFSAQSASITMPFA